MMKLNKVTVTVCMVAVFVLLIFFSKTIYTYNLPEVSAVRPFRGSLSKLEMSSGVADWAEVENTYAPVAGIIAAVYVKESDVITAGQAILGMDFKREDAARKLREIENNIEKTLNNIHDLEKKIVQLEHALAHFYDEDSGSNTAMGLLDYEIQKTRLALADAETAYMHGAMSQRELETAKNNLRILYLNCEASRDSLQSEQAAKIIDLGNLRIQEESYHDMILDYSANTIITAPVDGVLLSMAVEKGRFVSENTLMFSIGAGNEFTVTCSVSLDNNFVIAGDTCELSNSSHVLKGEVAKVKPTEHSKTITVTILSAGVTEGETFDIKFTKESSTTYTLTPNGALNQDNHGYFLNQVKRRKGILGQEYYLERLDVYIGDSDAEHTAIVQGVSFFEPLVLTSNKAVQAGDIVSLTNAGDFFEN